MIWAIIALTSGVDMNIDLAIPFHINGLVQDCSISSALAMSCTKLSICPTSFCTIPDKLLMRMKQLQNN